MAWSSLGGEAGAVREMGNLTTPTRGCLRSLEQLNSDTDFALLYSFSHPGSPQSAMKRER